MKIMTNKWPLLVFETSEAAIGAFCAVASGDMVAPRWAEQLGVRVWAAEKGDVFQVLAREEVSGRPLIKVFHELANETGWIFGFAWLELEETQATGTAKVPVKNRLVKTDKEYLLIYEDLHKMLSKYLEDKRTSYATTGWVDEDPNDTALIWSRNLRCKVWYSNPGDVFEVLNEISVEGCSFFAVIHNNQKGWIYNCPRFEFQDV